MAGLALTGCSEKPSSRWWQGTVEVTQDGQCVTRPGKSAVLEIDGIDVETQPYYPEAKSRILILLGPPEPPAGASIQIPSVGRQALLCISELKYHVMHDLAGSLRVLGNDGSDFHIAVQLESAAANWKYDGDLRFELQGRTE